MRPPTFCYVCRASEVFENRLQTMPAASMTTDAPIVIQLCKITTAATLSTVFVQAFHPWLAFPIIPIQRFGSGIRKLAFSNVIRVHFYLTTLFPIQSGREFSPSSEIPSRKMNVFLRINSADVPSKVHMVVGVAEINFQFSSQMALPVI